MTKNALITGASRGIGRAIAEELAREGYDLHLTCIHSESLLQELALHLEKEYQVVVHTYRCDVSSYSQIQQLRQQIAELDVLVNNAGISYVGLITDMTEEDWYHVLDTNLSSVFFMTKSFLPILLQQHHGKIINITSVWGSVGASMEVAYSASKGGVNSFTKALAKELAPSNIQVNAISCGYIDTDMNACFSEEEVSSIIEEIPADRIGRPYEVAQMVSNVIHMPTYTTGQIFTIDGGWQNT